MIDKSMDALVWLRKQLETGDNDLLREMVRSFAEGLMGAEADLVCGAPYRVVSPDRTNRRNGAASGPAARRGREGHDAAGCGPAPTEAIRNAFRDRPLPHPDRTRRCYLCAHRPRHHPTPRRRPHQQGRHRQRQGPHPDRRICSSCRPVHARVATTSPDVTGAQQLPWRCRPASEGRP